jgi:hypothetical protein
MLKKLWHDPVWSKVIAGVILAIGALFGTYFLDWWPAIGHFTTKSYKYALSSTPIPNWAIGILVLLALPTIFFVLVMVWQRMSPSSPNTPDWRNYTTDKFFGLRWQWRYYSDGTIHDMFTFCPQCDYQVIPINASAFAVLDRIVFHCESCGQKLGEFEESLGSLESKVERFIQQKIRNGTWLERVST